MEGTEEGSSEEREMREAERDRKEEAREGGRER